jgi:hypothetical protein
MVAAMAGRQRIVRTRRPVDLRATLGPLAHGGRGDPCLRVGARDTWRAADTVAGPATLHLRSIDHTTIGARAWGPGAEAALERVPDLVGAAEDPPSLAGIHPLVTELERRAPGLRLGRSGALLATLVPTVLEQRVIGIEAARAYRSMVRAAGRRAPVPSATDAVDDPAGPPRLLLPPEPGWLLGAASGRGPSTRSPRSRWATPTRYRSARRLADAESHPIDEARRRLFDYWVKHIVTHALTGAPRGTDERMLELLEPWRGQRGRVCRLLARGGPALPRFGPRLPLQSIARY